MKIVSVGANDAALIDQMARLLVEGFRVVAPDAWETFEEAQQEIHDILADVIGGFCRAALDEGDRVLGWGGGLYRYGLVWELHPLVVDPERQGQGVGRALVLDLEAQVRERGGLTVLLGTDDEADLTTLSGVDLYQDTGKHIAEAQGKRPHALEFYRTLGYTIVGIVPDANGSGKPDILMAKRVGREH